MRRTEEILGQGSVEELQELKEQLDILSAEYSDNPAYNAWMKQKYLEKKVEIDEE